MIGHLTSEYGHEIEAGIYVDRVAGGHRHYRNPRGLAAAGPEPGT